MMPIIILLIFSIFAWRFDWDIKLFACAIILSSIILIPLSHKSIEDDIVRFQQIKSVAISIHTSAALSEYERAIIIVEIPKQNKWLHTVKSLNKWYLFDIYLPDEIELLTPIE
jgi:hypothetical protein